MYRDVPSWAMPLTITECAARLAEEAGGSPDQVLGVQRLIGYEFPVETFAEFRDQVSRLLERVRAEGVA